MNALKGLTLLCLIGVLIVTWNGMNQHPTQAAPIHTSDLSLVSLQDVEQIQGGPSISATFIDHVLAAAHSPAQGIGATLYRLSLSYRIDDAFALAFFHHESSYGTSGMTVRTHSWGNIRCTKGWTCDPSGGYRAYASYAQGAQDWYALIQSTYLAQGLDTISKIIPVYAPAADDNNEAAYIESVLQDVRAYREGKVVA